MKLYSYWRSTTSYRVRAALNIKGLAYQIQSVDLVEKEQQGEAYRHLNPSAGVPTLELDDGTLLTQSMAIMEYLDARFEGPQLFPQNPVERAKAVALAHMVSMDIHPVNNLKVINELKARFGATPEQAQAWMCHWMTQGFSAIEATLSGEQAFAFGSQPNVADLCIVSQVYNARRWGLSLDAFPKIQHIEKNALNVPAIAAAHPDQQAEATV